MGRGVKEEYRQYITHLYQLIPSEVYEGLLSVFCFGTVVFFVFRGFKKGLRYSAGLLLVEYLFLLFCSTIFYRTMGVEIKYDWHPFWSYDNPELMVENVMNVMAFVPVGLLLGLAIRAITWWKVLLIGGGLSVSIETMQFFLKRGFAETDDVMHNTLGV